MDRIRSRADSRFWFTLIAAFSMIAFFCVTAVDGQPAGESPPEEPIAEEEITEEDLSAPAPKGGDVNVTADKIIHQGDRAVTQAHGDVVLTYEGKNITGEKGYINHETGKGAIFGGIHFWDSRADINGDTIRFNTKSNTGSLFNARGHFENKYFITGKTIEKKGDDRYILKDGTCSTCPFGKQSWRFEANEVDLTLGGYAYIKGMKFKAGEIPVFYLPYFIAPVKTDRATGFLMPELGLSDRSGFTFNEAFFWAISDSQDATVTYDYMGDIGNKYSLEYRYILAEGIDGKFNAEYLQETDPDQPVDRNMWKILYDHRTALPYGISNVIHVDRESEDSIAREYGDDIDHRTRRYTDSYATFVKTLDSRIFDLQVRSQQSTLPGYEDEVNLLPAISMVNPKQQLWATPLYGQLDASYYAYRTKTTGGEETETFEVDRFDMYPVFSLPITVAPWLSFTPELGYRVTSYSRGNSEEDESTGFTREYYTASLNVTGPKFFKIFERESKERPRSKHLITPSLNWRHVPDYHHDGDDRQRIRVLDGIDLSDPVNVIDFQLMNQLLVKEVLGPESARTIEMIRFNITQSYDLDEADRELTGPEDERRPLSPIFFDLDTRFFDWLMLNYDTTYNTYEQRWETSNLEIGFRHEDKFHLALDRSFKYPDEAWDTVYLEVRLGGRTTIDYSVIYDEKNSKINDSLLRLAYEDRCWGFALNWYQRKINVIDENGNAALEDESKIMFMLTLTGLGDVLGSTRKSFTGRKL